MASEPAVRRARPADLERVGALTVAAYAEFLDGPDDDYRRRLRDAASRAAEAELWVATSDDAVVGSVTLCEPGSPWREIGADDEGEFRMLAVDPVARGHGVGDALVRLAVTTFEERGYRGMVLSTLPQMHAAHRLYRRHGFHPAPERDWSPRPGVDLLAYASRF